MSERKLELIKYLETLLRLKDFGVKCDDKIKVALDELHKEMRFGGGDVYNITINQNTSKDSNEIVDTIVNNLKKARDYCPKPFISSTDSLDSITSTSDGGIKVTGTIVGSSISLGEGFGKVTKEEKEEAENPFDTIE